MATSTFVGSGEFVQETEWSCPYHDSYVNYYDDAEIECLSCEAGGWRKLWHEDGSPKMKELSLLMVQLRDEPTLGVICSSMGMTRVDWLEDGLMPSIDFGQSPSFRDVGQRNGPHC